MVDKTARPNWSIVVEIMYGLIIKGSVTGWQELELLEDDANVFKLIGPVLVKQDLAEAKANVNKRIEYITAEL